MILSKRKEIIANELISLITFINLPIGENLMDLLNKIISMNIVKYEYFYDIAEANNGTGNLINIENDIDDMIFDAYDIYYNIKDILNDAHKEYQDIDGLSLMWEFIPLYEKLLVSTKFSKAKTKTIQKMYFNNLLTIEIDKENFEYCSEIQKTIKLL